MKVVSVLLLVLGAWLVVGSEMAVVLKQKDKQVQFNTNNTVNMSLVVGGEYATQDAVEVVLKGNQMQYNTNLNISAHNAAQLASLAAQLAQVQGALPGLAAALAAAAAAVRDDEARVAAALAALAAAEKAVADDYEVLAKAEQALADATARLEYAESAYELAVAALTDYTNRFLSTLDASTQAAVAIINGIACTTSNQFATCNTDPQDVLAFWAQNGCPKTTGFICSQPVGHCICPPLTAALLNDTFGPTPKEYAVLGAGTLRSIVQEIRANLASLTADVQAAQAELIAAQNAYNAAKTAVDNANAQLLADQAQVESLTRQWQIEQAKLETDKATLGVAQVKYDAAVAYRDLLAARYAVESPRVTKLIAKLDRDNLALVKASVLLVSTIECSVDSQCQDGADGSLTFFAQLGCEGEAQFKCDVPINSCSC